MLATLSVFLAFQFPGLSDTFLPSPYPGARALVMISTEQGPTPQEPTVRLSEYRLLAQRRDDLLMDFAFYRPERMRIEGEDLIVARASRNLFAILDISIEIPSGNSLIRTRRSSERLPGNVDAWLLDDKYLATIKPDEKLFVLARAAPATLAAKGSRWLFSMRDEQGELHRFLCASLSRKPILLAHLMMLVLAGLILPVSTSLSLGEYRAARNSSYWQSRHRRWIFFGAKLLLIPIIVFFGVLDLAWMSSMQIQPHGLLLGYIFGFRWALSDQRRRCPVCLQRLTNPVGIGCASRTFLEWYGAEFICAKGHGLLYVPELSINSQSRQRWNYLDASWQELFASGTSMKM